MSFFTYELFLSVFPWCLSAISLTCAYCLSNGKAIIGRYVGVVAAIGWSAYGLIFDQLSFFFSHMIFGFIYVNAIYKFNSKRDQYKATFEEQNAEIARLKAALEKKRIKEDRQLSIKLSQIKKIAYSAEKNLIRIREIAKDASLDN